MSGDPIRERRSIRRFAPRDVPKALIEEILEAARLAPSAKNRQPWRFIVLGGEHKRAFCGCMEAGLAREKGSPVIPRSAYGMADARNTLRIMRQAPVLIVVLNENAHTPFQPVDDDARVVEICDSLSVGAAIENMLLRAQELGLGTLWIANTFFAYPELAAYLQTDAQLVSAVAVGYADEAPLQRPRKRLEEMAEYRL